MVSCLRCPNKAKRILITNVIFQSNHEQKKKSVPFLCFAYLNVCSESWKWMSSCVAAALNHVFTKLIKTKRCVTVKPSLVSGEIGGISCCCVWLDEFWAWSIVERICYVINCINKIILKDSHTWTCTWSHLHFHSEMSWSWFSLQQHVDKLSLTLLNTHTPLCVQGKLHLLA